MTQSFTWTHTWRTSRLSDERKTAQNKLNHSHVIQKMLLCYIHTKEHECSRIRTKWTHQGNHLQYDGRLNMAANFNSWWILLVKSLCGACLQFINIVSIAVVVFTLWTLSWACRCNKWAHVKVVCALFDSIKQKLQWQSVEDRCERQAYCRLWFNQILILITILLLILTYLSLFVFHLNNLKVKKIHCEKSSINTWCLQS